MRKTFKIIVPFVAVAVIVGGGFAYDKHNQTTDAFTIDVSKPTTAQQIPNGAYFAQVRKLSQGTKPACLSHDTSLDQTLSDIENTTQFTSSLSGAIGTMIIDMPAGQTTDYLHTYTSTTASGVITFSDANQAAFVGNLKSFNFAVKRTAPDKAWTTTSFITCE